MYVEGKLRTRKWQDKDGQDRYSTEVVVDIGGSLQMLDSRQGSGASGDDGHADASGSDNFSDDIPF